MFDVNSSLDLAALKEEVLTDPTGVGYNAASGSTQLVLDGLNQVSKNTTPQIAVAPMTAGAFLFAIFDVAISSQDQFKIQLLFEGTADLEEDLSRYRLKTRNLSAQISNAVDTIQRPMSRAEVLFSNLDANGVTEFVTINRMDWIAARDSV